MGARRFERGQLIPIFALMLIVLMGISALAVDVGYWRYQQRVEQTAADAAAISGADELNFPAYGDWNAAALAAATQNGFTGDGGVTTTVTATNPPATGTYASVTTDVMVVVSRKQPSFFGNAFGLTPVWVTATAVASQQVTGRGCVYVLSTGSQALDIQGAALNAPKCGIVINGGLVDPGGSINSPFIGYVIGPYAYNGQSYGEATPQYSAPFLNPCPSIPGCAYLTATPPNSGTCLNASPAYNAGTVTVPAGRYCTKLSVTAGTTVAFAPGVFELDAGIDADAPNITGAGVTLYNGASGTLLLNSQNINISAPTSGNTQGVSLFQNPSNTTAYTAGGGTEVIAGLMYFPTANVQSNGTTSSWSLVIAYTFGISGGTMTVPNSTFVGFNHAALIQ